MAANFPQGFRASFSVTEPTPLLQETMNQSQVFDMQKSQQRDKPLPHANHVLARTVAKDHDSSAPARGLGVILFSSGIRVAEVVSIYPVTTSEGELLLMEQGYVLGVAKEQEIPKHTADGSTSFPLIQ